jgi:hypothetical protein
VSDNQIARAQAAYHAYGAVTDHKNYQGLPMPTWPELPEKIRAAWVAASNAAAAYVAPVLRDDLAGKLAHRQAMSGKSHGE